MFRIKKVLFHLSYFAIFYSLLSAFNTSSAVASSLSIQGERAKIILEGIDKQKSVLTIVGEFKTQNLVPNEVKGKNLDNTIKEFLKDPNGLAKNLKEIANDATPEDFADNGGLSRAGAIVFRHLFEGLTKSDLRKLRKDYGHLVYMIND